MPPVPARTRRFGRFFGNLFSTAGGFAAGAATADTLRPGLQDLVNTAWETHPSRPLDPAVAAQAEVVGAWNAGRVREEAAYNGVGPTRADVLRALAGSAPGVTQTLQLWNRGAMTEAEVERALRQNGIRAEWFDEVKALRFQLTDAAELARMAATGVIDYDDAATLALRTGVQGEPFDRLYRLALAAPDVAQLLELRNRGRITQTELIAGLRKHGLSADSAQDVATLRAYLLPPSDVIRLAVHEVYDPAKRAALDLDAEFPPEFAERAARLGISEQDAKDLWAGHWGLPSYSQASEMLFRGEITRAQFNGLLAALDYAPTWRDKLANIARRIPTMSDFTRLAAREVYNPAQRKALGLDADYPAVFTEKAALHGMNEQDARDLWAAHWRLPSATQGYRMLWREQINADQLDGLLKALDYPALWRDRLAAIARIVPGRIDTRRMLAAGLIDEAQAERQYRHMGYSPEDARMMVQLAQATATSTAKDLTLAQLMSEYQGQYIDRPAFLAQLAQLGYSEAEAQQLANLTDAKRVARARDQFVNRIHGQFVGHKITSAAARAALVKAEVNERATDLLMDEWENEREVNVSRLTKAQVKKAYTNGLRPRDWALDMLTDQGMSDEEAGLYLDQ